MSCPTINMADAESRSTQTYLQMQPLLKAWHPNEPTSKGTTAYRDAVIHASWYIQNLNELIRLVGPGIKPADIVVDFGAGTGVSSVHLLNSIDVTFALWLVDNSAAWLGKAHDALSANPNVKFFLLEKREDKSRTLAETIGGQIADHVISANTFHLIPDIENVFKGLGTALKASGTFAFQSGNIIRDGRPQDIRMIDDTVTRVHDLALDLIRSERRFLKYRDGLADRVELEDKQRKFVFPEPRHVDTYLASLERAGFVYAPPVYRQIRVRYDDWLDFLRVRRRQAGILPEIGSKTPTSEEERDRDELITLSAQMLFAELEAKNTFPDDESFTAEWVYVMASKR